jgi:hypothetical protein
MHFLLLNLKFPNNRPDHEQQHVYHHDTKVKQEATTAVVEFLMMGVRTPETCWAVNKRQDSELEKLLHLVGVLFELHFLLTKIILRYTFIILDTYQYGHSWARVWAFVVVFQSQKRVCEQNKSGKRWYMFLL